MCLAAKDDPILVGRRTERKGKKKEEEESVPGFQHQEVDVPAFSKSVVIATERAEKTCAREEVVMVEVRVWVGGWGTRVGGCCLRE